MAFWTEPSNIYASRLVPIKRACAKRCFELFLIKTPGMPKVRSHSPEPCGRTDTHVVPSALRITRLTCTLSVGQREMARSHGHRLRFPELRRLPTQGGGFVSSGDSLLRQSFCFLMREVLTLPAFRSTCAPP